MAKPGERTGKASLEVRGAVDVEKFRAARSLGGDDVSFELRAMKPTRPGASARPSCVICLICIICIVCAAAKAEQFGIEGLPALEG
jgi:hypothetical protein